jgi:hypothetical protein
MQVGVVQAEKPEHIHPLRLDLSLSHGCASFRI